ncbi:hypothetical protein EXVG_00110 [Emiliania huxleyi virus 202]|nr:hypothetical protein EXVG_00110 [Emiliania huxleyi virus 202]AHA54437.1 putative membrane protein [Emiliania huxleyi virus 18]AHA55478.1 putative membrane protein [Emiliania huxleyi virus 156]
MTFETTVIPIVFVSFAVFWFVVLWCQWNNKRQIRLRMQNQRAAALQTVSINTTNPTRPPVYESVPGRVVTAVPVVVAEIVTQENQ